MSAVEDGYQHLEHWLGRSPVIANIHPLVPLALSDPVRVLSSSSNSLMDLDDCRVITHDPILILKEDVRLANRFPVLHIGGHPPIDMINQHMHCHLEYIREHLLTSHKVADNIINDVSTARYDVIVLMLIDGLSYGDTLDWNAKITPCFIDGPSVTYRLHEDGRVLQDVGFASIINRPSIFSRLSGHGYRDAVGYTYWKTDTNAVSDHLFERIPTIQVANFEAILREIDSLNIVRPTYIQVLREGLDGLAHSKRELSRSEIEGALIAIRNDIERLLDVISAKQLTACVYVTADHGVLWKNEHHWQTRDLPGSKPRYTETRLSEDEAAYSVRFERSGRKYYAFRYPYLGSRIRSDDSGVHGGLSYQESFVPFMKFKVD